jgi:hypothetical protein
MGELSVIDRLHRGPEERAAGVRRIFEEQHERERQYAADALKRHFEVVARGLSSELFADCPDVVEARLLAAAARHRYDQVAKTNWQAQFALINDRVAADLQAAEAALEAAALDDVLAGDAEFVGALIAMERVERCRHRAEALRLASGVLSKDRQRLLALLADRANAAEARFNDLLLALKRDYLTQHPELLNTAR